MTKPNEPEGLQERVARELCRQAGYDPDGAARNGWGWRNYMDGAAQIVAIIPAQPVADAGGVTDADREAADAISVALLQCVPPDTDLTHFRLSVADLFARHRLQSVAAATAAKDAEIARPRSVIKAVADGIERGEDCWRRLYETMCCNGDDCGCMASSWAQLTVHDLRAALSEAREAGV